MLIRYCSEKICFHSRGRASSHHIAQEVSMESQSLFYCLLTLMMTTVWCLTTLISFPISIKTIQSFTKETFPAIFRVKLYQTSYFHKCYDGQTKNVQKKKQKNLARILEFVLMDIIDDAIIASMMFVLIQNLWIWKQDLRFWI